MTALRIHRMLDISTGHLSLSTRSWLDHPENINRFMIFKRNYGWALNTAFLAQDSTNRNSSGSLPSDLQKILDFALAFACHYIQFDADAAPINQLDWYEDSNDIVDKAQSIKAEPGDITVLRILDVSMSHLSTETKSYIRNEISKSDSSIFSTASNFAINTYYPEPTLQHSHYPSDLVAVLQFAFSNKIEWVLFDHLGAILPSLPRFDLEDEWIDASIHLRPAIPSLKTDLRAAS